MPRPVSPRAPTTSAAAVLIVAITLPFAAMGLREVARLGAPAAETARGLVLMDVGTGGGRNFTTMVAGLFITLSLAALFLAVGIYARRAAAREISLLFFGLLAVLALAGAVDGLRAQPPAPNAGWGLLVGLADLVVVGLLLARPTAHDFEVAQGTRERARVRR